MEKKLNKYLRLKKNLTDIMQKFIPNIYYYFAGKNIIDVQQSFVKKSRDYINELDDTEIERFIYRVKPEMKDIFLSGGVNPELFLYALRIPEYFSLILNKNDSRFAEGKKIMSRLVSEINQEVIKNGAKTIVVDLPYGVYVSREHMKVYADMGFDYSDLAWKSDLPLNVTENSLDGNQFFIPNLSIFRKNCRADCFFKYDDHMTVIGNSLISN